MRNVAIAVLAVCVLVLVREIPENFPDLNILKPQDKCKDGKCPVPTKPEPEKPKPKPKRPWGRVEQGSVESITLGSTKSPNGKEIQIDFPLSQHIENIGSHVDGAGMCVMSSIEMAARWQNLEPLRGLRDWCAKQPGGGYPSKVDKQLREYFSKINQNHDYVQYEGTDLSILRLALKTGRFPAITYAGRDKVRYSGSIAHMVCLAHLDDEYAAIWDNNGKPGELIWMTPDEFKSRWIEGGSGWAFVWIAPPPPPVPH